jgi:hypothetical protein
MPIRFVRSTIPKRAVNVFSSSFRAPMSFEVRNFATNLPDTREKKPEQPASLLAYGMVSSLAYGSVYLSVLGGLFLAMEANVITPDQLGVDIDIAIQQVSLNASRPFLLFLPHLSVP